MSRNVYYGLHGEYGPYTMREYGLPDAGEVFEEYRRVKLMSVQDFVESYNKEVAKYNEEQKAKQRKRRLPTITRNLVYKWEKHNMVPTDPERRRFIANILNIPLALFGIVAAKEILFKPAQQAQQTAPAVVSHQTVDLLSYEENVRTFWRLYYTSTAQDELYTIKKTIQQLEEHEQQFRGNLQRDVRELLYSYYLLADFILWDQGNFAIAYTNANNAVRVAKSMQKDVISSIEQIEKGWHIARAYYARGYTRLCWGLYSTQDKQGRFQPDLMHLQAAIADFEEASKYAAAELKGSILLELGRAQGLSRGGEINTTLAQKTTEAAGNWVGIVSTKDDLYAQILRGRPGGLTDGAYHLGRAITFNATGRPNMAIQALDDLEQVTTGRIPHDQTRNNAWVDIIWAQTALGMKDFDIATTKATNALLACQDINSITNIATIKDIYARLLQTNYKEKQNVKNLGKLLTARY